MKWLSFVSVLHLHFGVAFILTLNKTCLLLEVKYKANPSKNYSAIKSIFARVALSCNIWEESGKVKEHFRHYENVRQCNLAEWFLIKIHPVWIKISFGCWFIIFVEASQLRYETRKEEPQKNITELMLRHLSLNSKYIS